MFTCRLCLLAVVFSRLRGSNASVTDGASTEALARTAPLESCSLSQIEEADDKFISASEVHLLQRSISWTGAKATKAISAHWQGKDGQSLLLTSSLSDLATVGTHAEAKVAGRLNDSSKLAPGEIGKSILENYHATSPSSSDGPSHDINGITSSLSVFTKPLLALLSYSARPLSMLGNATGNRLDVNSIREGIVNASMRLVTFPVGVVSNINNGHVQWAGDASQLSLNLLLLLSFVAYPAALIGIVWSLALIVGLALATMATDDGDVAPCESSRNKGATFYGIGLPDAPIPILPLERLPPLSRKFYAVWVFFCRCIPALAVFGLPIILAVIANPKPHEVVSTLTVLTTGWMFTNGVYVLLFGIGATWRLLGDGPCPDGADGGRGGPGTVHPNYQPRLRVEAEEVPEDTHVVNFDVVHWVILPQYQEDIEVVSMTLRSIAQSALAHTAIGIVLAMEEREADARLKVQSLRERFDSSFLEILETYHPADVPNDPMGKASNTSWAFKCLVETLEKRGCSSDNVILTVSDADTDFHIRYFDELGRSYLRSDMQESRDMGFWQSNIFHAKNYHRQPAPVVVGTVFTAFVEMAGMADPNSVRLPYSSYSLTLSLARRVGGWDPQWIAEDSHMGIKCYLLTFGKARVRPIMLPTLNYTPEEDTLLNTLNARWIQLKRHQLGFSDITYVFMTIPLILAYTVRASTREGRSRATRDMLTILGSSIALIIKICNIHVMVGIGTSYGILTAGIRLILMHREISLNSEEILQSLLTTENYYPSVLLMASVFCSMLVTVAWVVIYEIIKDRIEPEEGTGSFIFKYRIVHWLYVALIFQVFGLPFFCAMSVATWRAAWLVLTQPNFTYEVASKPSQLNRHTSLTENKPSGSNTLDKHQSASQ